MKRTLSGRSIQEAKRPTTPAARLEALFDALESTVLSEELRIALLQNPGAPFSLLARALQGAEVGSPVFARRCAALCTNPLLGLLALEDPRGDWLPPWMGRQLAQVDHLPAWLLRVLAGARLTETRRLLAGRADLGEALLAQLAHDAEVEVRRAVARNPVMPLARLCWMLEDPPDAARDGLLRRPDLDEETLSRLARDPDPWLRVRVAEHGALPVSAMAWLAEDANPRVRAVLLRHPRLPPGLWRRLRESGEGGEGG